MLRNARQLLGLTQATIADATGLSIPTIINLERGFGRYVNSELLRRFLLAEYEKQAPLSPEERDKAFRLLIGISMDTDPSGRGRRRNRRATAEVPAAPKAESAAAQDSSVAALKNDDAQGLSNVSSTTSLQPQPDGLLNKPSTTSPSLPIEEGITPFWNPADLVSKAGTASAYIKVSSHKGQSGFNALLKRFYDDVRAQHPTWLKGACDDGNLSKKLRRLSGVSIRDRQRDPDTAKRHADIFNFAVNYVACVEQHAHSKSAYQGRSWQDQRATLLGYWDTPEFKARLFEVAGRKLAFGTFEHIYRALCGKLSPAERANEKYVQACLGDVPDYAGQYLQIDGSGIPVEVLNGWGKARADGDLDQVAAFITDVLSLRTWIHTEGNTSEVYLWSPLLMKFFRSQNFAPEKLLTDLGGRLFHTLRAQQPGQSINLDEGLRLALAVGVQPANHTAHNARAKGVVERAGVGAGKSSLKRVLVARIAKALFTELSRVPLDHGHVNYRQIASEMEWREIVGVWERMLNARKVHRVDAGQYERDEVWMLPQYVERRAQRALVADWTERYGNVIASGFCMEVRGQSKLHYKGARAELRTALAEPLRAGSVAILFPGGLRKGDEQYSDELLRGVIIEPREHGGLPTYHGIEALKVKKSFAGYDLDRPKVNEHPKAIPETEHERQRRVFVEAGKVIPAKVRQATTDDIVDQSLADLTR
ncbi:MAG TPA: helix-turn-helix domain-containing protein [Planctomycetota bacterium]|jgi:transcriptional regulator with XRE-family HTH domain